MTRFSQCVYNTTRKRPAPQKSLSETVFESVTKEKSNHRILFAFDGQLLTDVFLHLFRHIV